MNDKDIIFNTTTTVYSAWDCIKLMFGGKSITDVEILTNNEVGTIHCIKSSARTQVTAPWWINRLRKKKGSSGTLIRSS